MAQALQGNEVEETIKRVLGQDRVSRYMVFSNDGIVLKYDGWHSSQDQGYQECVQIAANVAPLMHHSTQSCEEVLTGPNNEIECLRLKTKKFEMVIAPGRNFTLVAFQEDKPEKSEGKAVEETA